MLDKIFHSQRYLGKNKKNYFEGWYYKTDGDFPFAYIVGVSKAVSDPHSFIQYADTRRSAVFRFPLSNFSYDPASETVRIAGCSFSRFGIKVNLCKNGERLNTNLKFSRIIPFKKSVFAPSVMGPFAYLPMPCNHAVIHLFHRASGSHSVGENDYAIENYGYIEKDFGRKFPDRYAWMQGFCGKTSIMAAVAWPLPLVDRGFLCVVSHENRQYNFSLYTGTKLKAEELSAQTAKLSFFTKKSRLDIAIQNTDTAQKLLAPVSGGRMRKTVLENLSASFSARLILNEKEILLPSPVPCAYEFT